MDEQSYEQGQRNLDNKPAEMSLKEAYYEFQKTDEYNSW